MNLKYISFILLSIFITSCVKFDENSGFSDDTNDTISANADVHLWVTTKSGTYKFKEMAVDFSDKITSTTLEVDENQAYQAIDGYGGTLTGSSAYLLMQMSADKRTETLKSLFDPTSGIGLESLRISIGSSDFSMGLYTYCDKEGLENFAIPELDKRDLLPVLKEILAINPNVKIIASPWSPPAWMKSSNDLNYGTLKGVDVYGVFAEYFVKYIQAMKSEGITIDAITLQNEADFESYTHPSMKMPAEQQAAIIGSYLGPKFATAGINAKILILDHNFDLYKYALTVLGDATANQYIHGTAFHGYAGTPANILPVTSAYPTKAIYQTELSGGDWNTDTTLGTMFYYLTDFLVPTMQNGSSNFMMFNIALNSEHGPVTPGGTFCEDCRGIVTIDGDNVVNNLEYTLLSHFSKVSRTGGKRIKASFTTEAPSDVTATAFRNPDGSIGLVLVNSSQSSQSITISIKGSYKRFVYSLEKASVYSFLIK